MRNIPDIIGKTTTLELKVIIQLSFFETVVMNILIYLFLINYRNSLFEVLINHVLEYSYIKKRIV